MTVTPLISDTFCPRFQDTFGKFALGITQQGRASPPFVSDSPSVLGEFLGLPQTQRFGNQIVGRCDRVGAPYYSCVTRRSAAGEHHCIGMASPLTRAPTISNRR